MTNFTFIVCTANPDPDLAPLKVYEVVRGEFDSYEAASVLQTELAEAGESSQMFERRMVSMPRCWIDATNYASQKAARERIAENNRRRLAKPIKAE